MRRNENFFLLLNKIENKFERTCRPHTMAAGRGGKKGPKKKRKNNNNEKKIKKKRKEKNNETVQREKDALKSVQKTIRRKKM